MFQSYLLKAALAAFTAIGLTSEMMAAATSPEDIAAYPEFADAMKL